MNIWDNMQTLAKQELGVRATKHCVTITPLASAADSYETRGAPDHALACEQSEEAQWIASGVACGNDFIG
ncbi:hypothetical protein [Kribbella catacumbae]|uniref:hypothetical protein n=1 Tax=Kribbella catacumbae TaxID=460086 RepID=UPI00035DB6D4|nr:hypothetical protein [Kribbella catacumbae]